MRSEKYIMVLDQGTTSSRAILLDKKGNIKDISQKEFAQIFPKPGWVEHNPDDIWNSQLQVSQDLLRKNKLSAENIAAMGITNQRETTIVWDRKSGKPIYNAIVWQDRRTSGYCDEIKERGLAPLIQSKTGLLPDAYFSATKIHWILNHVDGAKEKARNGELAFGTVDTWLMWNLSGGKTHVTDPSNASRTLIYNIHDLQWDQKLLDLFQIPKSMLPGVVDSSGHFAQTDASLFGHSIPITGVAGDQQAALFGQMCIEEGMIKNTYGTGCFIVMNTGEKPIKSNNNLLSTIAWRLNSKTIYALEGSIFVGGAVVQWLRDGLQIIDHAADVEELAASVEDNGGVYLVPAFTGLGAPHWDQFARGTIVGLTRGSDKRHIARAALEAIALQSKEVLDAMMADSLIGAKELRVDGGASANNLLMQIQADFIDVPVVRPRTLESTALGAGFLAGLEVGFWRDLDELKKLWKSDKTFHPGGNKKQMNSIFRQWKKAVGRAKNWEDEN